MERYKLTGQRPRRGMLTRYPRTPEGIAAQVLRWREEGCSSIWFNTWDGTCYISGIVPDVLMPLFEYGEDEADDELLAFD